MPLWLIGMMGSGKTTIGRLLAAKIGSEFLDTDQMVESAAGRAVAAIFAEEGERGFRAHEARAVAAAASQPGAVVATGGGAVLLEENVRTMKASGPVVWLDADPGILARRLAGTAGRPLLGEDEREETLRRILDDRRGAYQAAADHVVATDRTELDPIVDLIEELWNAS